MVFKRWSVISSEANLPILPKIENVLLDTLQPRRWFYQPTAPLHYRTTIMANMVYNQYSDDDYHHRHHQSSPVACFLLVLNWLFPDYGYWSLCCSWLVTVQASYKQRTSRVPAVAAWQDYHCYKLRSRKHNKQLIRKSAMDLNDSIRCENVVQRLILNLLFFSETFNRMSLFTCFMSTVQLRYVNSFYTNIWIWMDMEIGEAIWRSISVSALTVGWCSNNCRRIC